MPVRGGSDGGVGALSGAAEILAPPTPDTASLPAPVTWRHLQRWARQRVPIPCLTCYDATTARWLQRAGVPMLLVGDTAAEMILGLPGTIHAPLEFMLTITAAVRRGAPNCYVMGDMPFLSYHGSPDDAVINAGRFMRDGGADIVKLEVDSSYLPLVERMARAGIAVCAHVGCRPQHAKRQGGYLSAGRTAEEALRLVDEARAFESAGASMLLLEAIPAVVAEAIVARSGVPVIGCGAGPACHGQVVVLHDLLGLTDWQPAFAPPAAKAGVDLVAAADAWIRRVRSADLPALPYRMSDAELERFRAELPATTS